MRQIPAFADAGVPSPAWGNGLRLGLNCRTFNEHNYFSAEVLWQQSRVYYVESRISGVLTAVCYQIQKGINCFFLLLWLFY